MALVTAGVMFISGFITVFTIAIREYVRLFGQIGESSAWPEDVACPMLWSDPISE
jgi:hypothetical protein